jgi:hypothetical protein
MKVSQQYRLSIPQEINFVLRNKYGSLGISVAAGVGCKATSVASQFSRTTTANPRDPQI